MNVFDVYLKNSEKTHSPEGLIKAKGNTFYNSYQFFRDFGIPITEGRKKLKCYADIICRKYDLETFSNPISSRDNYAENSITEVKITFKTFARRMITFCNYQTPITACIISINNCIPVGVRVTGFDPVNCLEYGFFIHLNPDEWEWENREDAR